MFMFDFLMNDKNRLKSVFLTLFSDFVIVYRQISSFNPHRPLIFRPSRIALLCVYDGGKHKFSTKYS